MTYDPAFMNTASCHSAITYLDGDSGILRYRGYPIEQLAVMHGDASDIEMSDAQPTVVIVGLGPAGSPYLTTQAHSILEKEPVVLVRTERHLAAVELVKNGAISLDHHYEEPAHVA